MKYVSKIAKDKRGALVKFLFFYVPTQAHHLIWGEAFGTGYAWFPYGHPS